MGAAAGRGDGVDGGVGRGGRCRRGRGGAGRDRGEAMILLVNGPNLNLLGEREPDVYGHETLADVERMVSEACAGYGLEVKAFQSNWEGALLDFLQEYRHVAQGVILNPGALTHTSRALGDCLRALPCPAIEVHVSNIHGREAWRRESLVAP